MSLNTRLSAAMTRIGGEIKSVRAVAASKYTKPSGGIPLGDLSAEVQAGMGGSLSAPGVQGSGILGGVKNPDAGFGADKGLATSYGYSTISIDNTGEMSSGVLQLLANAVSIFRTGTDFDGVAGSDANRLGKNGVNDEMKKMLKAAMRWEQEILVQPGTRALGGGPARMGIYVPYQIRLKGVRYQFETATTGGTTEGFIYMNQITSLGADASLNLGPNLLTQTRSGLDIIVPAGSRLDFFMHSVGSGTIGRGLYMALWGEYDLDGVTL
ncbi:hypothetical protein HWC66_gp09 [Gordonia phage Chikenjars]|uniref:Uncharacterized protein n=1 Tax=Gordonia phage Chikenjars TaxID=2601686 RepID=A0A5J6D9C9_9CAUD|nr:hypothetical protein HWC66_gp09 [Gordonia phage Chikenjars]QEQ94313.1 hypothetical protein SEA_CHIKENJARS_9 [Gordonia phage Chikenjars]QXO14033.1 hypothetical protein SEA_ALAINAMARIE_9 [Gordonia phage AlainaMarie]QYC53936.1 hypothetical protein SEA_NITHYA_9 [Gordonia phage Nithya]WNN94330.1 hypothetical protein SEA_ENDAVE_9 [Gordonia phage EndAve]